MPRGRILRSSRIALRLCALSPRAPLLSTLSHCPLQPVPATPSRKLATMNSQTKGHEFTGESGKTYTVVKTLQEEDFPPRKVYLAQDPEGKKAVLKYIHEVNYSYLVEEIYARLRNKAHHLRLYKDTIPAKSMFVFEHFTGHLLELVPKRLPILTTKQILKQALLGIAELHDSDIIHTDIKADNVFINWTQGSDGSITVHDVQLADLEDAAYLPPGMAFMGKQAGNQMWRSPEAHAGGPIHKPSDIFSFAIVMIYALTRHVIFDVPDSELDGGKLERLAVIIDRQMSYFGELDSVNALIGEHLDADNPYRQVFRIHRDGFGKDHPRAPIRKWVELDDNFKDLVEKMTDFNPKRRITAREALAHAWFAGV